MTTTQQEIFDLLPATVKVLSVLTGLSRRTLYYHLDLMKNEGLVWVLSDGTWEKAGKVAEL